MLKDKVSNLGFFTLVKRFFAKKWIFKIKQKVDVLIMDDGFANLSLNKICKYKQLGRELYIFPLIFSLFDLFFSKEKKNLILLKKLYLKHRIKLFDPKIAIGHEINNSIFYFKKFFPEKLSIVYQFGNYFEIHKAYAQERFEGAVMDYFLVWDEWHKNFFNFVNTKNYIVSGSVKNNEIKDEPAEKVYDIMFISSFRTPVKSYAGTNLNIGHMRSVDVANSYVARILSDYCEKKKKKITLALVSNRKDKKEQIGKNFTRKDELDFYKRDIKNFSVEDTDSIKLAKKSNLTICVYSTLGPELLSRGDKVLFLDIYHFISDLPFLPSKDGPFWYKGQDPNIIKNKIDFMLNLSNSEWHQLLQQSNVAMKFDQNNEILKKLVSEKLKLTN